MCISRIVILLFLVQEFLGKGHTEILCQMTEIIGSDGLSLDLLHGQHLHQDLCRLFYGMYQAEGQVEIFSCSEGSAMCPDR